MTIAPVPRHQPKKNKTSIDSSNGDETPIVALKELVASLQRDQNKIQDLLSSLGFALRSFSNLNQFLELTPLMAARVTDSDGGALILFKNNGQLRLEQIHCYDNQICQEVRHVFERANYHINKLQGISAESLTGERQSPQTPPSYGGVTVTQSSQILANLLDEQLRKELDPQVQIFGIPVLVKNIEQGRLYVFSSDPDYVWNPTRRKLAQLVADQTAVAIANHELTVELRSKERQDRELEIASEIQLRLLPSKCPQIHGIEIAAQCKTANRVGGDYYDFIPTNYDRDRQNRVDDNKNEASLVPWSIVIGDVMGKGVPAGLIMTMTRGMLRAEVLNRHTPARIMQHLNRVMYADLENSHRFVSMFYSEYDPKTRTLSFTNAAHNPPLWWQAKTNSLQKLDTWGMLIGLDPDSEYEDDRVILSPGDTIMYYTDGFTDAVNASGDRFEEDNLSRAFQWACLHLDTTQEILDHLFNEVAKFVGAVDKNTDDMTLIVMKVK
ncbi:MAG: PP2C family protein-serine/threonine phosphatase [Xenococcaceae cyanobacterium MO_188.B29]|nr:PP2C family protein-serine/threonine phosphatase [Xenococcaceae cyanobacterium MO_188.B29]